MEHQFFNSIDWEQVTTKSPPKLHAYLPATFGEPEFYSEIDFDFESEPDQKLESRNLKNGQETSFSQPST